MKTTKLVMITALVSFVLMSFANTELGTSKNVIHLKTAITNPELAAAIQSQVDLVYISKCKCAGLHTEMVRVKSTVYLIQATFAEWRIYYYKVRIDPIGPGGINPSVYSESAPNSKVNPFSEANPFSNKGKKLPVKKAKPPLVDKH